MDSLKCNIVLITPTTAKAINLLWRGPYWNNLDPTRIAGILQADKYCKSSKAGQVLTLL